MADDADRAGLDMEMLEARRIAAIRHRAGTIAPGVSGECDQCGEDSPRLVGGCCARCRDRLDRYRARDGGAS